MGVAVAAAVAVLGVEEVVVLVVVAVLGVGGAVWWLLVALIFSLMDGLCGGINGRWGG